ncbi:MAG: pyridoxamine 5-phosphate oxidase [Actinomycetia bacterium]|nr:pyridoxamine 5-phosphate oxidase [Actinomycetes bacterium]
MTLGRLTPMARAFPSLNDELRAFVERQHLFFVATAPLAGAGHVNVSPKGGDTLRILDEQTVAYLDISGSGIETVAHLQENGRITIMCCAFEGNPDVVRLYGRGEVVFAGDERFAELRARFGEFSGVRSIVVVTLDRVSSSCGFGVPLMAFVADRDRLEQAHAKRGEEAMPAYWASKNSASIDGLPGIA